MHRIAIPLIAGLLLVALAVSTSATASRAAGPDNGLLAAYEPVMQFDPTEHFLPTKVESFITDSALEQFTATDGWVVAMTHAAPGDLPSSGADTWRLDQRGCTPSMQLGGLDCYSAAGDVGGGGPTVYGRVTREGGDIILQYWFFYYDDVYSYTYPATDFIWQAHEGDWEDVNVVLTGDEQPLYVGYSQHCSGERHAWGDTVRFDDTHPIVHVAVGSHANYFAAGTHPINIACIPPAAVAILRQNGLPLPVDYAFPGGATVGPPHVDGKVMPIDQVGASGPKWLQFPGTWGEQQYFHAPPPIGTVPFGASPVGPAFHAEWIDPLATLATWPLTKS